MKDLIKAMIMLSGFAIWGCINRAYGYTDGIITATIATEANKKSKETKYGD